MTPKIQLNNLSGEDIMLDEIAVLQFVLKNQESFALRKISVTCRQLDTDEEQPQGYEFPSLFFESDSNVWQARQSYEIASELTSGSEVRK
jgi:hypothetical protein